MPHLTAPWTLLADAAALLVLLLYHARLVHHLRHDPGRTVIGRNRGVRRAWLAEVIARKADILAVQTLRNWAMTATFLASTAILVAVGIVHFMFTNVPGAAAASELLRAPWAGAKLLTLASLFFVAFFCFAQTLRALNHLGFEIVVARDETFETVLAHLHRHADSFTLGMRSFYFSLPVSLWLFGAAHFLAATLVLTLLLAHLDYVRDPGPPVA